MRLFDKGREGFADKAIDWDTDNIKVTLVDLNDVDTGVKAITGATTATPIVITATSHGFANGDIVVIFGVGGNTTANGTWKIKNQATNTFELETLVGALNSVGVGAYTSGGTAIDLTLSDNLDDVNAGVVATSANLSGKTLVNGLLDHADLSPAFTAVTGDICEALIYYFDSGAAATSRLIFFNDGRTRVIVAADAAGSATTLWIEPLERDLANSTVIIFSNGIIATLSAGATAGARSLTVTAISGAIAAGHHGDAAWTGNGFPITPNGNDINLTVYSGGLVTI
jgi:hypothetical protein